MKAVALISAVFFLLVSCSKNKPGTPEPPLAEDTLSAGWSKVIIPNTTFTDIDFINNDTGYLLGTSGLYKSIDGGHNWQPTSTGIRGSYLTATANGDVFVTGDETNTIYSSFDGGFNFSATKLDGPVPLTDSYFTGNDTGYVPAGNDTLYRTTDGGHNWQVVAPVEGLSLAQGYYIPFFINGHTGWISDGSTVFHTLGSVNSWSAATGLPNSEYPATLTLSAPDANVVYTPISIESNVSIYKSTNGGMSFFLAGQIAVPNISYTDIHFTDANTGYVCNGNSIFATTDGGTSWKKVVSIANGSILEIHFTDRDHGWACGFNGLVLIFKK